MASSMLAAAGTQAATSTAANASADECKDEDDMTSSVHSCSKDPDFAVICAFFQKFATDLGMEVPNFKRLQEWLSNTDEIVPQLQEMHIKLLRKTRKTVHEKNWESAISKFCFTYSAQDGWEVERFGYKKSSLKVKLRILRELLESQFERNAKFRAKIVTMSADSLRSHPIGRDRLGHTYWLTQDDDCNLRIYQEHLDEEIWQIVASNREELVNLIARLRGNEVVLPSADIGVIDEDSSSNSLNTPIDKPPPPEEQDDSQEDEARVPNLRIKINNNGKRTNGSVMKTSVEISNSQNTDTIAGSPDEEGNVQMISEDTQKKLKPIFINQSKIVSSDKRQLDETDKVYSSSEDIVEVKRPRPSLLDSNRIRKPSKYENVKSDEEDDDESDYDDEDESDAEVGKAIEEPTLLVRGDGSGKDCDVSNQLDILWPLSSTNSEHLELSEIVEEDVMFVFGDGSGADCTVGNSKNEPAKTNSSSEPKATFFFGEPGCLQLSPIKQALKMEIKRNLESQREQQESETAPRPDEQKLVAHEKSLLNDDNSLPKVEKKQVSVDTNDNSTCEEMTNVLTNKDALEESEGMEPEVNEEADDDTINGDSKTEKHNDNKTEADCSEKILETIQDCVSGTTTEEKVHKINIMQTNLNGERSGNIEGVQENVISVNSPNLQEQVDVPEALDQLKSKEAYDVSQVKTDEVSEKAHSSMKEDSPSDGGLIVTDDQIKNEKTDTVLGMEAEKQVLQEQSNKNLPAEKFVQDAQADKDVENPESVELGSRSLLVASEPSPVTASLEKQASAESEDAVTQATPPPPATSPPASLSVSSSMPITPSPVTQNTSPSNMNPVSNTSDTDISRTNSIPAASSSLNSATQQIMPNRKRRLTDMSQRHSTSESEIDHSELPEDQFLDDDYEEDVGGKRLKMRPKIANVELRKRIEAKKVAVDETTSSSGEEDSRHRRKVLSPKKHIEKEFKTPKKMREADLTEEYENETKQENKDLDMADRKKKDEEESIEKRAPLKQKPTLAEIIEKKLKKTSPEKVQVTSNELNDATCSDNANETIISPLKKGLITKPLKKNVLTQMRQEESEEETIPRKLTISEDKVNSSILEVSPTQDIAVRDVKESNAQVETSNDRITSERQRKRRSSDELKSTETNESEIMEGVSEKLKRNSTDVKLSIDELQSNNGAEMKVEKEETKLIETNEASPPNVGRRSGRRVGAAVVHAELPQAKRTRGGSKTPITNKNEHAETQSVSESLETMKEDEFVVEKQENIEVELEQNSMEADNLKKVNEVDSKMEQTQTEVSATMPESSIKKEDVIPEKALSIESKLTPTNVKGRGGRKKKEVDTSNIIETTDTETPVRQSRRIALQKIREEAERRKLEEIALRSMKEELKKKKKAEKECDPTVPEPSEHSSSEASEVETKKKSKKKCPGKDGWSSGSEEQEDPEEDDEEPPHYESDPCSPLFKSDHEFSPESDLEDESQVVPMKRARTARKEDAEEGEDGDEEACQKCGKSDHPEWILLCDNCDKGYHCSCLSPVLFYIPEGDWYCPPCQQEQLIEALEKQLKEFDELVERKRLEDEEVKRIAEEQKLAEQERLAEELERKKRKKMKMKNRHRSGSMDHIEDDETDRTDFDDNAHDDDDDKTENESIIDGNNGRHNEGAIKKSYGSKSGKGEAIEKGKRRRNDGRSRRRAAIRGARRNRRHCDRSDSESGSGFGSSTNSDRKSESDTSSSAASDSDDEPIYKLRKRRQINVSYRLNEFDDLINSALKKEMDEVAGAGNLGRGKDISTIIEADKEEKARQKQIDDNSDALEDVKLETNQDDGEKTNSYLKKSEIKPQTESEDDDDIPLKPKSKQMKASSMKKKPRKLTTLDISSEEDDASDEDFKTSSFEDDDEEEDTSISISTNSDSSLEIYRRRGKGNKSQRKAARRAARERRKDRRFVVEESDEDEDDIPLKSKKNRKEDSDYSESETGEEDLSELTENMDSADLCDDTTSEESDGAWHPSKRKKQKKSTGGKVARKSPKLKKTQIKKAKRIEYSDDDISESEEEEEEDDNECPSGKGSGKQPRSQPPKTTTGSITSNTIVKCSGKGEKGGGKGGKSVGKPGKGKGKGKVPKKKAKSSGEESFSDSEDSTRRTRGRRYAYLEDFDDESSDGGIKPGVKRPDTPPEEREKFIQRQEEIKRMLAEKNSEGAKLAATPRLTPIKAGAEKDKRPSIKPGDSLSTVPLSVIRQAKVLDIDYLQRKGEPVADLDNVDDVESEFDDADLPDDFPEDMDEDAIARMVEEEEFGTPAAASRDLPAPDDVLKTTNKSKDKETEKPMVNASLVALAQMHGSAQSQPPPHSGLQEPMRKRLPMPTMHPPLLRQQFPPHLNMQVIQRHPGPPTPLLHNALSAPLGQSLSRNLPVLPPGHPLPPHLMPAHQSMTPPPNVVPSGISSASDGNVGETPDTKPRGRRKKITPLRDSMQKQQSASATSTIASNAQAQAKMPVTTEKSDVPTNTSTTPTAVSVALSGRSVIKTPGSLTAASSLTIAQPPQLYKPPGLPHESQPSVITRIPHIPGQNMSSPPSKAVPPPTSIFPGGDVSRFYGPPQQVISGVQAINSAQRQREPLPHLSGLPPTHSGVRPTYGPPPPLRGSGPPLGSLGQPPISATGAIRVPYGAAPGDHHSMSLSATYGGPPPPARHSPAHLNPYRQPIYGNPNFVSRPAPPGAHLRPGAPPGPEYAGGNRGYPPYGYYPPPPPLTAAHQSMPPAHSAAVPSSVIVTAPPASSVPTPAVPVANHNLGRVRDKSPSPNTSTGLASPSVSNKSSLDTRKKLTTLEAYQVPAVKSPLPIGGESSGSRSSPGAHGDGVDDSTSTASHTGVNSNSSGNDGRSEFSGLVSYFSSQHDDYNT